MKINWEGIICGLLTGGLMGGVLYMALGFSPITIIISVVMFIGGYYKGCEPSDSSYVPKSKELKNAEHEAFMMGMEHGYYSDQARTARQNADIVRAIENNK